MKQRIGRRIAAVRDVAANQGLEGTSLDDLDSHAAALAAAGPSVRPFKWPSMGIAPCSPS